jgi:hypothetical protein
MSAEEGSRITTVIGFPSGQFRLRALKIFTNSEAVRFEVVLLLSETIASCFAWTTQGRAAAQTNSTRNSRCFLTMA